MILKMYTVLDDKTDAYLTPFFCRARGEAMRNFMAAVSDPEHQFHKYAADFSLWEIGEWDDSNGLVVPSVDENGHIDNPGKTCLGYAIDFLDKSEMRDGKPNGDGAQLFAGATG